MKRLYLSPPHMGKKELAAVKEVFRSNWISSVGPALDAFEAEFAKRHGLKHAVALSSGTAALHLAVRALNLKPGEEVLCSTLTFAASANPVVYEGGRPIFVDSDPATWNIDAAVLADELSRRAKRSRLPRAVIAVDLYGQCADMAAVRDLCSRYEIPLIEDAAEALGATQYGKPAGSFGWANIFSFNGNKIITTSGGGMLGTDDAELARKVRFLAQQAKDPAPHYQHSQIGFNYRMSNVLAAIGREQLALLDDRVKARRRNFEWYRSQLGGVEGITFMPEPSGSVGTRWLTVIEIDAEAFGATPEEVRLHLERSNIESRPVWKPMHLQPVFAGCETIGGAVSEKLFARGLCLPSGSALTQADVRRVAKLLLATPRRARALS